MQALLRSVAPIIAAEEKLGGRAISEGWADVTEEQLEKWSKAGQEKVRSGLEKLWDDTYDKEYARLFRRVSIARLCCDESLMSVLAFGITKESQI